MPGLITPGHVGPFGPGGIARRGNMHVGSVTLADGGTFSVTSAAGAVNTSAIGAPISFSDPKAPYSLVLSPAEPYPNNDGQIWPPGSGVTSTAP